MMNIAITGSNGLIGQALCSALGTAGHTVTRVVRGEGGPGRTISWDPARGTIDAAAFEPIDAVVHLAGEGIASKRWSAAQKDRILTSRTTGTSLLATAMASLNNPPRQLLSGSAIGYYGDTGSQWVDENGANGADFLASVCRQWERAAAPARAADITVTSLRTGIVLSTKGGALAKQLLPFKLGLGGKIGSGEQFQSWITLDDEVRAIMWLLEHPYNGPVNLTAPSPVTNAEFTRSLGAALHRPTSRTPLLLPQALLGRELVEALLLTSQRVKPAHLVDSGFEFLHPTLDEALHDLLR